MISILDGNSEIDGHVRRYLCYFINMFNEFDYFESSDKSDVFFLSGKTFFLYACATCFELPSNMCTMAGYKKEKSLKLQKLNVFGSSIFLKPFKTSLTKIYMIISTC